MRIALPTLLACLAVGVPAAAQGHGDRWQVTTESGEYLWDIRLVRLGGDTLFFQQADTLGAVRVAQIGELRLIRKTLVHAEGTDRQAETMAALMGGSDEVFDLRTLDFAARLQAIRQLLLLHPPGP